MRRQLNALVTTAGTVLILTTAISAIAQEVQQARALDPAEAAAIMATGKHAPTAFMAAITHQQTAVPVQVCFTCGGDWPVFAGAIHAVNTGSNTFERGSGCSGGLAASNDTDPFICTR
ncbi:MULTISPECIES: hypothetical protein [Burkholderia]|uniref:hypothetical protein n=1 Tax=Burkholderia TaxID=32008 RepID=UPI001160BBBF|nr:MULTISPECIES: hypothetical protein [Burkholderia]